MFRGLASFAQSPAGSTCPQPLPMPPQSLHPQPLGPPPATPPCVDAQGHASKCRPADINRYNAAIGDFNVKLAAWNTASSHYTGLINDWTRSAGDFRPLRDQRHERRGPAPLIEDLPRAFFA